MAIQVPGINEYDLTDVLVGPISLEGFPDCPRRVIMAEGGQVCVV
jgi:hypothetical protein